MRIYNWLSPEKIQLTKTFLTLMLITTRILFLNSIKCHSKTSCSFYWSFMSILFYLDQTFSELLCNQLFANHLNLWFSCFISFFPWNLNSHNLCNIVLKWHEWIWSNHHREHHFYMSSMATTWIFLWTQWYLMQFSPEF